MSPAQVAAKLQHFNEWRRGHHDDTAQPDPREIGEAIDAAIEMIERLEAAEKSDAESLAMYRKARDERDALRAALRHEADCVEAAKDKIEALRAKIEAMERQEPVAEWIENKFDQYPQLIWDEKYKAVVGTKLYALPGAKGEEK